MHITLSLYGNNILYQFDKKRQFNYPIPLLKERVIFTSRWFLLQLSRVCTCASNTYPGKRKVNLKPCLWFKVFEERVWRFTLWIMSSWLPSGSVLPSSCISGTKEYPNSFFSPLSLAVTQQHMDTAMSPTYTRLRERNKTSVAMLVLFNAMQYV